jgi:uncharacterized protein YbaR (Trm112 family)
MPSIPLSKELLQVLVCPHDRGDLEYSPLEPKLTCRTCGKVFPIENGVPNMLKGK